MQAKVCSKKAAAGLKTDAIARRALWELLIIRDKERGSLEEKANRRMILWNGRKGIIQKKLVRWI